jgi:hypothetical protein
MTDEEKRVIKAAMAWWKGRRPCEYTHKQHVENPTINVVNDGERRLAWACGDLALRSKRRK